MLPDRGTPAREKPNGVEHSGRTCERIDPSGRGRPCEHPISGSIEWYRYPAAKRFDNASVSGDLGDGSGERRLSSGFTDRCDHGYAERNGYVCNVADLYVYAPQRHADRERDVRVVSRRSGDGLDVTRSRRLPRDEQRKRNRVDGLDEPDLLPLSRELATASTDHV